MMLDYSMEALRQTTPNMTNLTPEERDKAMYYLGAACLISLMGKAHTELDEKQEIIVAMIHDEIDTELLLLDHKIKKA